MNRSMLKFIFIGFIFIFCINSNSFSQQKIASVEFVGLKNVKLRDIKDCIKTKKGDVYVEENLSSDLQNLLNTGYFDNVEVEFDTTTRKVIFNFQERPLIKKIEFRGNKKISTSKLKENISLKEKEYFVESKLQESKDKILELYDEKGYIYTVVEDERIVDTDNKMHIIFLITEGKKILVEKIDVVGVKKFSKSKILKLMETKKKKVYRENILRKDVKNIEDFYKNHGFYDVEVSSPVIKYNEDEETVNISINIFEGPIYKIKKIEFYGNLVYSDRALFKAISLKKNQVYNQQNVDLSVQSIAELYADKGYLKVNIVPEIEKKPQEGTIKIKFNITEGEEVYIDRIYIEGLTSTKEEVIRREILLKEGDIFSSRKLRRSMQKIYNLGFLDDVRVDLQPGSDINKIDLEITVVEGRPGMLSAGAGYSTVDQLVGNVQVSHMNLFGRAQRLNLMWEFGARRQNYEISWTEPWFLKKPLSLNISLYDLIRQRDYANEYNAYKEQRQGVELRFGPRISDSVSLSLGYSYENVRIFDSKVNEIIEGKKLTSSFISQLIYDTRDNIFDASRGMRHSVSLQVAGWGVLNGDVKFYKPILRFSVFVPTFWKFVLSFNTTLGYIEGIEGYDINDVKYEKFYVGGAETVRGYRYRELGPADGGKVMCVFNAEYKFPIVQENKRTILQGALFYDLGGAWNEFKDIEFIVAGSEQWEQGSWDNRFKHSVGVGLRFTTPVFPIRLDWSWALNPRLGRDPLQFWFTIGQMF